MGIGSELQVLGQFLDECERRGDAVESVDVAGVTDTDGGKLAADLDLTLSFDPTDAAEPALCDPQVGADGTVRFALESTRDLVPVTDSDVDVEPSDVTLDGGTVTVSLAAAVPAVAGSTTDGAGSNDSGGGRDVDERASSTDTPADTTEARPSTTDAHSSTSDARAPTTDEATADDGRSDRVGDVAAPETGGRSDPSSDGRDRDVPPFKDPDLLAEVYDSCETFAEMADELDMDVTAETVRRYMIDFDIHEPNTYQTGGGDAADAGATAGDDDRPVVLSDGIGLPDDVTVDTLVETVKRSNTIYEVKQDIDVERDDALEMLRELNLLDIVVGRLATEGERDITREDVVDRLREASAVQ